MGTIWKVVMNFACIFAVGDSMKILNGINVWDSVEILNDKLCMNYICVNIKCNTLLIFRSLFPEFYLL